MYVVSLKDMKATPVLPVLPYNSIMFDLIALEYELDSSSSFWVIELLTFSNQVWQPICKTCEQLNYLIPVLTNRKQQLNKQCSRTLFKCTDELKLSQVVFQVGVDSQVGSSSTWRKWSVFVWAASLHASATTLLCWNSCGRRTCSLTGPRRTCLLRNLLEYLDTQNLQTCTLHPLPSFWRGIQVVVWRNNS